MTEVVLRDASDFLVIVRASPIGMIKIHTHLIISLVSRVNLAETKFILARLHPLEPILCRRQAVVCPTLLVRLIPYAMRINIIPAVKALRSLPALLVVLQLPLFIIINLQTIIL